MTVVRTVKGKGQQDGCRVSSRASTRMLKPEAGRSVQWKVVQWQRLPAVANPAVDVLVTEPEAAVSVSCVGVMTQCGVYLS